MKISLRLAIVAALLLSLATTAQVVTTIPSYPLVNGPVTVIFDATQGDGGLAGYTGDVYAHTGVITENSTTGSDWKYVKSGWGENLAACKLTRVGTDLYELEIQPDVISYYGVPLNEQIFQMAFVFRSDVQVGGQYLTGREEDGGDIFIDVYEPGLNVTFQQPSSFPLIVTLNESFDVEVLAAEADSIQLYYDNALIQHGAGLTLSATLAPDTYGRHSVKALAYGQEGTVADSFYCYVRKPVVVQELPPGIRDGINYPDATTATLSLVAPGKEYIYVIGDFNDWEIDSNYYMKMTPDGERFWLEINGLVPAKEYIFQYFIDGKIRVGDPYADKVSDPWNDSWISSATYPGLIQYPAGKTSGIATVLQTDQQAFNWEVDNFQPPSVTDLVVYELLVRDFTTKHSYEAVKDSLDYLQRLGINALELMPVNEFEGNSSWGYNPSFYFAPDKYYGPKDKLKQLVDECHKRGMAVIMDMVLNHAYDQCPLVQMYFDGTNPTPDNPWFNVHSNFTNPDAQWGNDFNHESPYTQALVDSINSYWMSEYRIDGFRFDFTKGFSNNIKGPNDPWGSLYDADRIRLLERMSDQIWARNSDAIVIFEHLAENSEETVLANYGILLWGNLNYNYGEAAMGWNDNSDFSWISYKKRGWNDPHVMGYMESHDEERLMFKCYSWGNEGDNYSTKDTITALNRMMLNSIFFFTIPGPKMIWQFEEYGYDISIDFNGRIGEKPVLWNYLDNYSRNYLLNFYSSLIRLKKEEPVFETDNYNLYLNGALKRMVLYSDDMNVVILGNFDVAPGQMQVSFPGMGTWYDYFTGDSLLVNDLLETIDLQAGEYRMYTSVKLETPQIGTGISDVRAAGIFVSRIRLYPNPANEILNIEFLSTDAAGHPDSYNVEVFNSTGSRVGIFNATSASLPYQVDVSAYPEGIYFVRISDSKGQLGSGKFLKVR